MHSHPLVVSVILNTNRCADTLACLASLHDADHPNHEVLVLDNASSDGSVKAIRSRFPDVEILELTENWGYAGNNNVGILSALAGGADWVFVLNEDVIIAPDAISHMLEVGKTDPRIGIVGPLVYHYDEPDVIQSAGGVLDQSWLSYHRGQNETDRHQYKSPEMVDWVSGCAIFVRGEMISQVGLLDERFFYYWEETEWCLRARRKGWKIVFLPEAKLWHKGVQRDYKPGSNITYYWTRNWLLMLTKHRAPIRAWVRAAMWIFRNSFSWTLNPKWREKREHRVAMWEGVHDFLTKRWGMRGSKG